MTVRDLIEEAVANGSETDPNKLAKIVFDKIRDKDAAIEEMLPTYISQCYGVTRNAARHAMAIVDTTPGLADPPKTFEGNTVSAKVAAKRARAHDPAVERWLDSLFKGANGYVSYRTATIADYLAAAGRNEALAKGNLASAGRYKLIAKTMVDRHLTSIEELTDNSLVALMR